MSRGIPRHTLDLCGIVEQLADLWVAVHELLELGETLGSVFELVAPWYRLGDLVADRIGQTHYPCGITDSLLCGKSAEGDDLCDMVSAVLVYNIIYHALSAFHAEVDVEVRHRDPLGVQEALEQQIIFQRIDAGDTDAVGAETSRPRAASAAHGYLLRAGVVYEIPDYKVIVGIAHARYYGELVFKALKSLLSGGAVALEETLAAHIPKEGLVVIDAVDVEIRQLCLAELKIDIAAFGDKRRVLDRFGIGGEKLLHLAL